MSEFHYRIFEQGEIGPLYAIANEEALLGFYINEERFLASKERWGCTEATEKHPILDRLRNELDEYFLGKNSMFSVPLLVEGTEFQKAVWREMSSIPFGETISYSELAQNINRPKAVRAIGQACKANHFVILLPCHRVVGKNGALTGYAGDKTPIKEWLLNRERAVRR